MSSAGFKIPYGERDGELLHISAVERGRKCECRCAVCHAPLVARKGKKLRHHFAHDPGANCSEETVLHHLGKLIVHRRIVRAIEAGTPLQVTWPCEDCGDRHEGNLVKLAHGASMELSLGVCRPDATILRRDGTPVAMVEIVVSHRPDQNVLAYAAEKGVKLVEFHLRSADDLEVLDKAAELPATKVDLCMRPKCPTCGRPLRRKTLHVVDAPCWKCHAPMKIAMLNVEGVAQGPELFSDQDCAVARECGAILRINYSNTMRERYLSNTCGHCRTFAGSFYLHHYWPLMTAENGHPTGDVCLTCSELG